MTHGYIIRGYYTYVRANLGVHKIYTMIYVTSIIYIYLIHLLVPLLLQLFYIRIYDSNIIVKVITVCVHHQVRKIMVKFNACELKSK